MRSPKAVMLVFLLLSSGSAFAEKTDPEFLRQKHAGTAIFESSRAVADLYADLLQATQQCWAGRVAPGAGSTGATAGAVGGAMSVMSSASREVSGELEGQQGARISVAAVGFFGAVKRNMLQIDVSGRPDGTTVVVYYGRNVKAQKQFVGEVEKWLAGDLAYCEPKPFMSKKKDPS